MQPLQALQTLEAEILALGTPSVTWFQAPALTRISDSASCGSEFIPIDIVCVSRSIVLGRRKDGDKMEEEVSLDNTRCIQITPLYGWIAAIFCLSRTKCGMQSVVSAFCICDFVPLPIQSHCLFFTKDFINCILINHTVPLQYPYPRYNAVLDISTVLYNQ